MTDTNDEAMNFVEKLYKENYNKMLNMVRKDTLCAGMAEDIVQDAFTEAVRNAEKVYKHENPGGWLMETAKRKTMTVHHRVQRRAILETEEILLEIKGYEADYGLVEMHMVMDEVLNDHELMLLHMYYYGGYSAKELAEMEGITEGNFKVRMLRIREKVKQALNVKKKKKKK